MMERRGNTWANTDKVLVILFILLCLFGWVNIYSAGYKPEHPGIFDASQEYGKQFIWILVSLALGFIIVLLDSHIFTKLSPLFYAASMLLLLAVLLFGKEVNGARSWFSIGSFGIQPSEFAKPFTALLVAYWLTQVKGNRSAAHILWGSLLIIGLPAGLILLQPDTGTALVFFGFVFVLYRFGWVGNIILIGILGVMVGVLSLIMKSNSFDLPFTDWQMSGQVLLIGIIWLLGIGSLLLFTRFVLKRYRKRFLFWVSGAVILSTLFISGIDFIVEDVLSPHQTKRVHVLLGIEEDPQGAGYNVRQSKVSIGSGGFAGKGFLNGTLTKFKYVPMQSTDFIFCTVGEEWGFLGTAFTVGLFLWMIMRIVVIAERQRSDFTKVYAYAVASIFFIHLTINVGMTIGLAPVIGIPLPFFSYGGSSLMAFSILLGILLKLDARRLDVLR